jgi:hypothetical protein
MSGEAVGDDPTTDGGRPADEPGAVTWADIYDSPEVDRSLRRLPRLCREAVQLVWAAGRSGAGVAVALLALQASAYLASRSS